MILEFINSFLLAVSAATSITFVNFLVALSLTLVSAAIIPPLRKSLISQTMGLTRSISPRSGFPLTLAALPLDSIRSFHQVFF